MRKARLLEVIWSLAGEQRERQEPAAPVVPTGVIAELQGRVRIMPAADRAEHRGILMVGFPVMRREHRIAAIALAAFVEARKADIRVM